MGKVAYATQGSNPKQRNMQELDAPYHLGEESFSAKQHVYEAHSTSLEGGIFYIR